MLCVFPDVEKDLLQTPVVEEQPTPSESAPTVEAYETVAVPAASDLPEVEDTPSATAVDDQEENVKSEM